MGNCLWTFWVSNTPRYFYIDINSDSNFLFPYAIRHIGLPLLFITSLLGLAAGLCLYMYNAVYLHIFNACRLDYTAVAKRKKVGPINRLKNQKSYVINWRTENAVTDVMYTYIQNLKSVSLYKLKQISTKLKTNKTFNRKKNTTSVDKHSYESP